MNPRVEPANPAEEQWLASHRQWTRGWRPLLFGAALLGYLAYIGGAVAYYHRWLNPFPAVFGYHESFHVCVCVAATCQFIAIALLTARVTS